MSYELNDGLTMCGYTGFGNTYATPGAKQDTRTVTGLHARFVELGHVAEAQISVSVSIDYPSGQSRTLHGGLQLTPEQAAKLAAAIAPPSSVTKARCDALSAAKIAELEAMCESYRIAIKHIADGHPQPQLFASGLLAIEVAQ